MSVEYGIISHGSLSSLTTDRESGYIFTPVEDIWMMGFRLYLPEGVENVVCRLWDASSKTQIAACSIELVVANNWTAGYMDIPVQLTAGKKYAISCWLTTTRYSTALSGVTFNSKISVSAGCYTATNGAFPDTTAANIYQLIDAVFGEPYDRKYLIRSGSTLYTITDGALTTLAETEITANLFQTYGVDGIQDGALLVGLTDPEVLYWQDSTDELPTLSLRVRGTPPLPQIFTSEQMDLTHESISGISHAAVDASEDVRFAITFDSGATWKAHNGSTWFEVSDTAPGMLASTMNAITAAQWAEVVVLDNYRLRFWLPNVTAYVKSVVIHYINP